MNNYLYAEFSQACAAEGIAPSAWAEKNGLGKSMPTDLKKGNRPGPDTLKKLTKRWKLKEMGIRIFQAYLKDEIERVGLSLDNLQPVLKSESATAQIDDDLEVIGAFISAAPKLREAIHVMAAVLKVSDLAGAPQALRLEGEIPASRVGEARAQKAVKKRGGRQ